MGMAVREAGSSCKTHGLWASGSQWNSPWWGRCSHGRLADRQLCLAPSEITNETTTIDDDVKPYRRQAGSMLVIAPGPGHTAACRAGGAAVLLMAIRAVHMIHVVMCHGRCTMHGTGCIVGESAIDRNPVQSARARPTGPRTPARRPTLCTRDTGECRPRRTATRPRAPVTSATVRAVRCASVPPGPYRTESDIH